MYKFYCIKNYFLKNHEISKKIKNYVRKIWALLIYLLGH